MAGYILWDYEIEKLTFFFFKANEVKIVNIHERHNEDLFPRKFFWKLYHTKVKYKFKFKIEQFSLVLFFEKFSQICQGSANIYHKKKSKSGFPSKILSTFVD